MSSMLSPYTAVKETEGVITVLLVDDQEIIGEAVRRMVEGEKDISFYFCRDPGEAVKMAEKVKPTVIFQDLVMPELDGITLLRFFRANQQTKDVPMIMLSSKEEAAIKAEAFRYGANDYLVKLPDRVEFLARLRYHASAYLNLIERNRAYQKLEESKRQLADDLDQAAAYMISLLPEPQTGLLSTSWVYIPSSRLGGDAFGYHWLDENRFVMYLLDVCGHGVGAALLSITVMNVLRAGSLLLKGDPKPSSVLEKLNETFPMESHAGRFFTIWYGVYDKRSRLLTYASGGHPPALLRGADGGLKELKTDGIPIGALENSNFTEATVEVPPSSNLYIFSDGVFELEVSNGNILGFGDFMDDLRRQNQVLSVDQILKNAEALSAKKSFDDDFSIVRVAFQ